MRIQRWFAAALPLIVLTISTTHAAPLGIMVPAYFYPTPDGYWNELDSAAARVPLVVIMNPDNGPGTSKNKAYVQALLKLRHAGGKTIGYIHTSYGARTLADVEQDIDLYLSFYVMDGFFVDEMTNDSDSRHVDYYATIYQYIKAKGANYTVTGNPGSNTQENYIAKPTDDSFMIFEDNATNYVGFVPSHWVAKYSAQQFAHLPYAVATADTMSNYVKLAINRNANWIYITDNTLPNPYNALPSYWTNEVDLVQSFNKHGSLAVITHVAQATAKQ